MRGRDLADDFHAAANFVQGAGEFGGEAILGRGDAEELGGIGDHAFGGIGELLGVSDAIGAFLIGLVLGATRFRDRIEALIAAAPASAPVTGVVLDGGAIVDVDLMGCETLSEVHEALQARGNGFAIGNLLDREKRDNERGQTVVPGGGDDITFPDVAAAASYLEK